MRLSVRFFIHMLLTVVLIFMGADLYSTLDEQRTAKGSGCGRRSPPPAIGVQGYYPRKIFGNFICQTVHFGEYLCDNWSTEWVHFALLNTNVEAFLINFLTRQLYNVSKEIVT